MMLVEDVGLREAPEAVCHSREVRASESVCDPQFSPLPRVSVINSLMTRVSRSFRCFSKQITR